MDIPAFVLGSRQDPTFLYGVVLCHRELLAEIVALDRDLEVIGTLKSNNVKGDKEGLH